MKLKYGKLLSPTRTYQKVPWRCGSSSTADDSAVRQAAREGLLRRPQRSPVSHAGRQALLQQGGVPSATPAGRRHNNYIRPVYTRSRAIGTVPRWGHPAGCYPGGRVAGPASGRDGGRQLRCRVVTNFGHLLNVLHIVRAVRWVSMVTKYQTQTGNLDAHAAVPRPRTLLA
jgi:hypothetical protein